MQGRLCNSHGKTLAEVSYSSAALEGSLEQVPSSSPWPGQTGHLIPMFCVSLTGVSSGHVLSAHA